MAGAVAAAPARGAGAPASRWLLGRTADLGLVAAAPIWILPLLYGLAAIVSDQEVNNWVMALGAIGHHLPGMLRAYGDRALFRRFRVRFVLVPPLLVAACVTSSVSGFHGVALVAFLWGVWHGFMQTYGFARIFASKEGQGDRATGRLDFALLATWFAAAVILSPLRMPFILNVGATCGVPLPGPAVMRAIAWTAIAATGAATLAWVIAAALAWRRGRAPGPMRTLLIAGSIGFWWFANVRVSHPLLGLPLFELFHDVQYLAIVWAFNRRRADAAAGELAPWLRAMFRPTTAAAVAYIALCGGYGALSFLQSPAPAGRVIAGLVTASQLLHFYYDGFIWRVREPQTGAALGVQSSEGRVIASGGLRHALFFAPFFVAAAALSAGEAFDPVPPAARVEAIAELVPESAVAQTGFAEILWSRGDRRGAVERLQRAVTLDPDYAPARRNLALSLVEVADEAEKAGNRKMYERAMQGIEWLRPRLDGDAAELADERLRRYRAR